MKNKRSVLLEGIRDGIPIALGYFAVSFSLGIAMRNAGMTSVEGFFFSMFNLASAGEYAGLQVILSNGSYIAMALATLVANARYMLMSTALSQRFHPKTKFIHRLITGYGITDEIFGITINRKGYVNPWYVYGALLISVPPWALGTSLGIIAGNGLPANIVNALSVALYGMFIAIIVFCGMMFSKHLPSVTYCAGFSTDRNATDFFFAAMVVTVSFAGKAIT